MYSGFFGAMGATAAMVFSALGAGYGTAKSGVGIANMAVMHPELIMKSIIPVVMAGIIAIYGLVVSVLIANGMSTPDEYPLFRCVRVPPPWHHVVCTPRRRAPAVVFAPAAPAPAPAPALRPHP